MKKYNLNHNGIIKKRKKHNFLRSCLITMASLAVVVAGVVGILSIKPAKKLSLVFSNGETQQTNTVTVSGDRLTEDMLANEVEQGKFFSGWYYDDNYVQKAQVGDVITANTTLYGRQLSSIENTYWQNVENKLLASEKFSGGTGTVEDPYKISTEEDMGELSRLINGSTDTTLLTASYKLMNDIRLDRVDVTWPSIGTESRPFQGTFDGNNHMVYYIYGTKGLFNYVQDATIKNLTIKGLFVSGTSDYVGGLAGKATNSTIINCSVWGEVTSTGYDCGGLIGEANGKVAGCSSYINFVAQKNRSGGLIGTANRVDIYGCVNYGSVSTVEANVSAGGLVGLAYNFTLNQCINYGDVNSSSGAGGLVYYISPDAKEFSITNSFNSGTILKSKTYAGSVAGIIGEAFTGSKGEVTNTYNTGNIIFIGNNKVAGIVGDCSDDVVISNSYSLGDVKLSSDKATYNPISNGGTIENCGYNNSVRLGNSTIERANEITNKYDNVSNLYNEENKEKTTQDSIISSLKDEETYTDSNSTLTWNDMNVWETDIMDFTNGTPDISKDNDFTVAKNQVSYYINGLKKMVRSYKETQTVTQPNYNGYTVTYYTDRTYTTKYNFGNKITSNISLYGKCEDIADGVKYTISIDPDVTTAEISGNTVVTESHNVTVVLQTTDEDQTISNVEVAMANNTNPDYEFVSSTKTLTIKNICGNVVITPIFKDPLPTPITSYVDNVVYITQVTGATDYKVEVYKDNVLQSSNSATLVNNDLTITSANISKTYVNSYDWIATTYSGYSNVFKSNNYNKNSTTSYLKFKITKTGVLTFNYKVSSESNYDKLTIQILSSSGSSVSTICSAISGSGSWRSASVSVTQGQYFYAYYSKDGSQHKNDDRAYVANMVIKPSETPKYKYQVPTYVNSAGAYKLVAKVIDSTGKYAPAKVVLDSFTVYPIVANLTNCTMTSSTYVKEGATATIDLVRNGGYSLPQQVIVTMGGKTLTQGTDYTYNKAKSQVIITNVTGDINITVVAVEATSIYITNERINDEYSGVLSFDGMDVEPDYDGEYNFGSLITVTYDSSENRSLYYIVGSDTRVALTDNVSNDRITITDVTKSDGSVVSFRIVKAADDVLIQINCGCLVEGTYITLANGKKKKIEDITYDDELLVWDFDKGCFTKAKPFWIKVEEKADAVMRCEFNDGTVIETIKGHAVYSCEENRFVNTHDNLFQPGFTHTFNEKGEKVLLVKKEIVYKKVKHYNFHTNYYMNNFSNGILTSINENNLYPIRNMKFVKEERELIPYEEFEKAGVPRRYYDGLRLAETPREHIKYRIDLVKELLEPIEVKYNGNK